MDFGVISRSHCGFLLLPLIFLLDCWHFGWRKQLRVLSHNILAPELDPEEFLLQTVILLKDKLIKPNQILIRILPRPQNFLIALHILTQFIQHPRMVLDKLMPFRFVFGQPSFQFFDESILIFDYCAVLFVLLGH